MNAVLEGAPRAEELKRSHTRFLTVTLALFSFCSTIVLFLVSRGKWSDAIVDSGREWIVPDALARGELLYRDVVYWFGPLSPYFHAAFFRVFGSSFQTLVLAGAVGSIAILAALYVALLRITGKSDAALWTVLAVPTLIFMPNAGGSILGMGFRMWHAAGFSLLAIAFAGRPSGRRPALSALSAGVLCALAGLCRTEWGLAALAASLLAAGVRRGITRRFFSDAGLIVSAGMLVFTVVFAALAAPSGLGVLLSDAPVLLIGVPEITRRNVLSSSLKSWRSGVSPLLYSSAMWVGAFLLIEIAAVRRHDPNRIRRRAPLLFAVLLILGVTGFSGGSSGAALFSAAPVVCAAGVFFGIRGGPRPRAAALAGYGLAGLLVLHRRPFNIADAAYVAPPLLFAVCCAAGLLRRIAASERVRAQRNQLRVGIQAGIALLVFIALAGRFVQYASDDRIPIPGTEGMLSAPPGSVREISDIVSAIRRQTKEGDGLVVFPEGEVLNYLSGRRNPLRHKLFLPGYVNERNEAEIVRELQRARPQAVVIWNRPTGEYGPSLFGEGYARAIRRWIEDNYVPQSYGPPGRHRAMLAVLRHAR